MLMFQLTLKLAIKFCLYFKYSDGLIFGSNLLLDYILVHYNAYFEYQDDPFDSTILRNRPEKFKLGSGMLYLILFVL